MDNFEVTLDELDACACQLTNCASQDHTDARSTLDETAAQAALTAYLSTDRWKSTVAEVLTLGQADPYDIHIGWDAPTTVILDAHGNVVSMEGYPG